MDEDKKQIEEEFEKVKELFKKGDNGKYNVAYISRQLHEQGNLRKIFIAVITENPARISEISEKALLTKPTCYAQLFRLMSLRLVDRVPVMPIMNGTVKNDAIKKKFEKWTKSMPNNLKMYYMAKTSYWVITDFGKQFANKVYDFDQEFKEQEKKNG